MSVSITASHTRKESNNGLFDMYILKRIREVFLESKILYFFIKQSDDITTFFFVIFYNDYLYFENISNLNILVSKMNE